MVITCLSIATSIPYAIGDDKSEALVKTLVSTNPKPTIGESGRRRLPAEFDRAVQKRIVETWDKLLTVDTAGLSTLIAHYDDQEYSTSIASVISEYWHNWTVGEVCREIVISRIEPYGHYTPGTGDPRSRPQRPSYCRKYLDTKDTATHWWQEHQNKTLREIQLEALDWIIAEEKAEDAKKFAKDIEFLEETRNKLNASTKPLATSKTGYSRIYRLGGYEGN
jgi:hypothetical protein